MNARPAAFFLVGPTAACKTAVAQWLAEREGFEVLAADSMVVYSGLDIGTAKPSPEERRRARHYGLDLAAPDECYSVGAYREYALATLRAAARDARRLIVAGGTGLYVRSLVQGLGRLPAADAGVRAGWEGVYRREGLAGLQAALRARSPRMYGALADQSNPRRLMRALEMVEQGVREWPAAWRAGAGEERPMAALDMPPQQLKRRIAERVERMYAAGLVREVATLARRYGALSATARKAIGYAEALEVAEGRLSAEEAAARTLRRTVELARRQRTWFRHQTPVRWIMVEAGMDVPEIAARVLQHWRRHGPTEIAV